MCVYVYLYECVYIYIYISEHVYIIIYEVKNYLHSEYVI